MKELSEKLLAVVEAAEPRLRAVSEEESVHPILAGGWSRKQVIGHLIDSASNNHQRFVRAALQTSLDFPGYDQSGSVRVQEIQDADWQLLVALWAAYNRYLAYVIARLPASKLKTVCHIGSDEPVTLEFLATDYLTHLRHHLNQLGAANLSQKTTTTS
jgi:hypothetical protein